MNLVKILIIAFLILLAIFDIVAICMPSIKKYIEKRQRKKRQKIFGRKMKDLEIK